AWGSRRRGRPPRRQRRASGRACRAGCRATSGRAWSLRTTGRRTSSTTTSASRRRRRSSSRRRTPCSAAPPSRSSRSCTPQSAAGG
ncbi:hypothetical protein EMIHUDRAFT_241488, partial [Emiliania huxleyi CCMP1516]|uniref:Uncharacterized protein n=2 Tax=Emiliania huxleyi TaxID=2903 RepID=A0A0D3JCJ6_EMIH1